MLIISILPAMLQASETDAAQAKLVVEYFAQRLHISMDQIELELVHTSNIDPIHFQNGQIEIKGGQRNFNLGHQTLWMVHKVNGVIKKKYPITIDVYANLLVPVALQNISRLDILTRDLVVIEQKRIGREYRRVLINADQVYDKMATQMIREGRLIERNMVRIPPDVLMGDPLQIVLNDHGLRLELAGIAKEEGLIGEVIRVQCPATRKEFRGILENSKEVMVSLR